MFDGSLETLDLRGTHVHMFAKALLETLRRNKRLKVLKLGMERERDYTVHAQIEGFYANVEQLDLRTVLDLLPELEVLEFNAARNLRLRETETGHTRLRRLSLTYGQPLCPLNLPGLREVNVRATATLSLHSMCALTKVNLSCTPLKTDDLAIILRDSPDIAVLDLCYCPHLSKDPNALSLVLQHCTRARVTMLGLGGFSCLSPQMWLQICHASPSLAHIGIGGCPLLTESSLFETARLCPLLRNINAHQLTFPHTFWERFLPQLHHLRIVSLKPCNLDSDFLKELSTKYDEEDEEDWA